MSPHTLAVLLLVSAVAVGLAWRAGCRHGSRAALAGPELGAGPGAQPGGHVRPWRLPTAPAVPVAPAMCTLLTDYEDAVHTYAWHRVAGRDTPDEGAYLLTAAELHADVRRLREQLLDRVEPTDRLEAAYERERPA